MVFQPNRRTSLKLLYARGFCNPNDNELFFRDGKQYLGNLALKREQADNVKISFERKFQKSWDWGLSASEMRDKRAIVSETTAGGLLEPKSTSAEPPSTGSHEPAEGSPVACS